MKRSLPVAPAPAGPALPSPTVRTAVSFLLFVHLFALAAAILSTPRDGVSRSPLQARLGSVPFLTGHLQVLWMAMAYDYFHTYGNAEYLAVLGSDHTIEFDLQKANGSTETVSLPGGRHFPPDRQRRYQNLANKAALVVGQPGRESLLPAMLTEQLMEQTDAVAATCRIRRHVPQTVGQALAIDPNVRDPFHDSYYETVYTGTARRVGEQFVYQKVGEAGDVAPPVGAAPPPSSSAAGAAAGPATAPVADPR